MLDHLDASGRYALLKLATGALRIGVSSRLAKLALAQAFDLDVDAVEEVWHGIGPPYLPLFAWAEGRGAQPTAENLPVFRPFMLAHPLEHTRLSMDEFAAEIGRAHVELQSLMRTSYAVFCLKKKKNLSKPS